MTSFTTARKLYKKLMLARAFELLVADLFRDKIITTVVHSGSGQEAGGIAITSFLKKTDILIPTPRGFSYAIGKSLDIQKIISELLGNESGFTRGVGRYFVEPSRGFFGYSRSMGANFSLAIGLALAIKRKKEKRIVVCVFGEGAASRGTFHGALNLSKIWQLPILWVCENNQFSISTPFRKTSSAKNIADRASNYNMPGFVIDGNDVLKIYEAAGKIIKKVRSSRSPALIELKTYRLKGHYLGDPHSLFVRQELAAGGEQPDFIYQTEEEIKYWLSRDPLRTLGIKLGYFGRIKKELYRTVHRLKSRLSIT